MCLSIAVENPNHVLSKGKHLGYEWATVCNNYGYRCGYVRVPLGHPWHGKGYDDVSVEVHGGLTFAESDVPCDAPGPDTDWWLGFDCAHGYDAPDPDLIEKFDCPSFINVWPSAVIRTQEYAESEYRSLCEQAAKAQITKTTL